MKILIANATGKVGQQVVSACDARDLSIRLAARTPKAALQTFPRHQVVPFDFTDADSINAALDGVDVVFSAAPYHVLPDGEQHLIDRAAALGVKTFVKLSAVLADQQLHSAHRHLEHVLRGSGMKWSIVRANWFMQNYITYFIDPIREQGKIIEPAAMGQTSFVDTRDVGEAVATLLSQSGHEGRIYELTGGQAIDRAAVAKLIGQVTGRTIDYVPVDDASFRRAWSEAPAHLVDYLSELYALTRAGDTAKVTTDVRLLTGRDPISFDQFTRDYADFWTARGPHSVQRIA